MDLDGSVKKCDCCCWKVARMWKLMMMMIEIFVLQRER